VACNSVFVKRDAVLERGFAEDRRLAGTEDWALWLMMAARYPFHGFPVETSRVIQHASRSVITASEPSLRGRRDSLVEELGRDEPFVRWKGASIPEIRARMSLYVALHLILAHDLETGLRYWTEAVREAPRLALSRQTFAILRRSLLLWGRRMKRGTDAA
jgi:hypothetical protein